MHLKCVNILCHAQNSHNIQNTLLQNILEMCFVLFQNSIHNLYASLQKYYAMWNIPNFIFQKIYSYRKFFARFLRFSRSFEYSSFCVWMAIFLPNHDYTGKIMHFLTYYIEQCAKFPQIMGSSHLSNLSCWADLHYNTRTRAVTCSLKADGTSLTHNRHQVRYTCWLLTWSSVL